jgi:hypothetical protein
VHYECSRRIREPEQDIAPIFDNCRGTLLISTQALGLTISCNTRKSTLLPSNDEREMTTEEREAMQVDATCGACRKKFYICPACHGRFCDCTGEHDRGLLTDEQLGELTRPEIRVSALRTRLENTGYKSIWQTETINHAGDRTVISSWVPKEVPAAETNKGYKFSIYEDVLLVERFEGVDGIYPGEYCGSSTYIHGVGPKFAIQNIPPDDNEDEDANERAAQVMEEGT